ncbi:ATP-binding cassette domain-containing protein [Intestinibacillus massiliensis]|nr:ATP-binding cassette domain-containing protein [Intestinibacillus massiliensis]
MEIRFENVCKSYDGRRVLQDFNWAVRDGEIWRLEGASGIGKTTVLRLLLGLEQPDAGQITGRPGIQMTAAFQEHRLCPWLDARDNLRMVCTRKIGDRQIAEALGALLPADSLDQPVRTLSGGMQRRVAVVRALLPDSSLVVLDEPFAGLDRLNVEHMLGFITRERRGRAMVIVSHEGYNLPEPFQTQIL